MVATHEAQAEFLQAVGQPTRLRILEVLIEGERCICDIQVAVGQQQSNVSKHVAILRRSGILAARREGGRGKGHIPAQEWADFGASSPAFRFDWGDFFLAMRHD